MRAFGMLVIPVKAVASRHKQFAVDYLQLTPSMFSSHPPGRSKSFGVDSSFGFAAETLQLPNFSLEHQVHAPGLHQVQARQTSWGGQRSRQIGLSKRQCGKAEGQKPGESDTD